MSTILSGGRIVLQDSILEPGSLVLDDGLISDVRAGSIDRAAADWHDMRGCLLVPGFIDVHVHGVEGIDTLATADAVAKLAARFPKSGVTGFCPTTGGCSMASGPRESRTCLVTPPCTPRISKAISSTRTSGGRSPCTAFGCPTAR